MRARRHARAHHQRTKDTTTRCAPRVRIPLCVRDTILERRRQWQRRRARELVWERATGSGRQKIIEDLAWRLCVRVSSRRERQNGTVCAER